MPRTALPTLALLATVGLLLTGCAEHRVLLASELDTGQRLSFELALQADIERTLEGQARREHLDAVFDVTQEVLERLASGGARARMTLAPRTLTVDGRPVEVGPGQQFLVTIAPDGRIVDIGTPTGAPDEALAPVGLERLLPRLRPVLPGRLVEIGESWSSDTDFRDLSGRFSITLRSRLASLGLAAGRRAALVRTTHDSPVDRSEAFANAVAEVAGRDVGAQEAWFALDGFLLRASGDSVGRYSVTFRPPGGEAGLAPVRGSLVVRLHTEMRLVSTEG